MANIKTMGSYTDSNGVVWVFYKKYISTQFRVALWFNFGYGAGIR